jgi:hypothetical protein
MIPVLILALHPRGFSSSKGGKAAEGKDLSKFLSQNLMNGTIYTKKFIFYINIQAILFNHTLHIMISFKKNPCRHGKHGARFGQKTLPQNVYFLLSNGRNLRSNPFNPDLIPFVGERGSQVLAGSHDIPSSEENKS